VLKEQSNVHRHHPEYCHYKTISMQRTLNNTTPRVPLGNSGDFVVGTTSVHERTPANFSAAGSDGAKMRANIGALETYRKQFNRTNDLSNDLRIMNSNHEIDISNTISMSKSTSQKTTKSLAEGTWIQELCMDPRPLFVAQSSICCYVLSIGLSCYLVDLLLRRWRRCKSSIELLDVRLDSEGNLMEIILSNNHKRFARWLPGQFVYLNCPQISTYEWHPFTISSMDNSSRQFTLHIKTAGDWTRKLRQELACSRNSNQGFGKISRSQQQENICQIQAHHMKKMFILNPTQFYPDQSVLPNQDCYTKTGQLQIECTKLVCLQIDSEMCGGDCVKIDMGDSQEGQQIYSICHKPPASDSSTELKLNLFVDGPFHSPFERLLEQQVSVCIANGVGWTAFSSVFQCITNNFRRANESKDWWTQWREFALGTALMEGETNSKMNVNRGHSSSRLHLVIIVTSIEQLKPFYNLALNYFNRIHNECRLELSDNLNPIREIKAFITRCKYRE